MDALVQIEAGDRQLLVEIGETLAEAARRSGPWLVCRPGCTQCCTGPFDITQLDARRLQAGLRALSEMDPARAAAVRGRAAEYVRQPDLDELACPALDPATGRCDLYEARPVTCRAFGPATWVGEGALGACELCYEGATDDQMAACAVEIDPDGHEAALVEALAAEGVGGMTIVAYALAAG